MTYVGAVAACSDEVTRSMAGLGPRHVALAVNAAAARDGGERVLDAAAQRVLSMQKNPIRDYIFSEQAVAMIFNSFARTGSGRRDPLLFACLSEVFECSSACECLEGEGG